MSLREAIPTTVGRATKQSHWTTSGSVSKHRGNATRLLCPPSRFESGLRPRNDTV